MAGEDTIRLIIAEDHGVVREGLRRVLADDPALVVVAEAVTGYEILSLVLQHQPDVLLLDLDLPGQGGLEALRSVQAHVARPPRAIILSAFLDEEYVRRARELRVAGYLPKRCAGDELRRAIHRVMAGKQVFDPAVVAILKEQHYSNGGQFQRYADGSSSLTETELAVLERMPCRQTYEGIAQDLGRKYKTVRAQAGKIYVKLEVSDRQQAVLKALELGLLHLRNGWSGRQSEDSGEV